MTRPRDSQRQKVYRAKVGMSTGRSFKTVAEMQDYVNQLLAHRSVRSRWGAWIIHVKPGNGHRRATGGPKSHRLGVVQMPLWSRNECSLLHELAHCLQPHGTGWHGREFCGTYLFLVKLMMGPETATWLRASYRKHGVKVGAAVSPTIKIPSQTVTRQKELAAKRRPLDSYERKEAAAAIRRAIASGVFGPSGRHPRTHALEVARTLEK